MRSRRKITCLQLFWYALRYICVMEHKTSGHGELHIWYTLYRTQNEDHFIDSDIVSVIQTVT
jgi:hypothetical protein